MSKVSIFLVKSQNFYLKMNSDPLPISKNVDTALESVQRVQFSGDRTSSHKIHNNRIPRDSSHRCNGSCDDCHCIGRHGMLIIEAHSQIAWNRVTIKISDLSDTTSSNCNRCISLVPEFKIIYNLQSCIATVGWALLLFQIFFIAKNYFEMIISIVGDASYALYLLHWPMVCVFNDFEVEDLKCEMIKAIICLFVSSKFHADQRINQGSSQQWFRASFSRSRPI